MREIKFRAWDAEEKRMLYDVQNVYDSPFSPAKDKNGNKINDYVGSSFGSVLDDMEVMQYTGLKDRNGKEIYEGDIIAMVGHEEYERLVISWDINCFNVPRISWRWEVIGNIHENPELLSTEPVEG